jgi:DNA-binding IclR family transcriptional regulator
MVIRATTNSDSPVSVVAERVGSSVSVLGSSLGQAYLAFSDDVTRDVLLDVLASSNSSDAPLAKDRDAVQKMLCAVRRAGHAERIGGIVPRTFSLGLPVFRSGRCEAAINVICFPSAITLERARGELLPKLRKAALDIGHSLELMS